MLHLYFIVFFKKKFFLAWRYLFLLLDLSLFLNFVPEEIFFFSVQIEKSVFEQISYFTYSNNILDLLLIQFTQDFLQHN